MSRTGRSSRAIPWQPESSAYGKPEKNEQVSSAYTQPKIAISTEYAARILKLRLPKASSDGCIVLPVIARSAMLIVTIGIASRRLGGGAGAGTRSIGLWRSRRRPAGRHRTSRANMASRQASCLSGGVSCLRKRLRMMSGAMGSCRSTGGLRRFDHGLHPSSLIRFSSASRSG